MSEKLGKLIASYSDSDVTEDAKRYMMENNEDNLTEKEIEDIVYQDAFIYQEAFKDECRVIGEVFMKRFPTLCAKAEAVNVGWRRVSGHKYICLDQQFEPDAVGWHLINQIAPEADFSFNAYLYKRGIYFSISDHDSPAGYSVYLTPCARSTYDKHK